MARINIEDSIFKDGRFIELCMKTQSIDTALGALVRAWSLAQKWYLKDDRLIPMADWKKQKINDLIIDVGLAVIIDNKIKVDGADEQFSWLIQKQEAGKKGGLAKSEKNSDPIKQETGLAGASESLTGASGSKPLPPTLPLSLSLFSDSNSSSDSNKVEKKPKKLSAEDSSDNRLIKAAYIHAYRVRWGVEPITKSASFNSIVSKIRDKVGVDIAINLVGFYLQHNKRFYVENTHSIKFCLNDIETLCTQMSRGQQITSTMARNFEKKIEAVEYDDQISNMFTEDDNAFSK